MTGLIRRGKRQDGEDEDIPDYEAMSDEEFFEDLEKEIADELGVSREELDDMSIREVEDRLEIDADEPYTPLGHRAGYLKKEGWDTLGKKEQEERSKKVGDWLGLTS